MKKVYNSILLFYLILHYIIPWVYYLIFGKVTIYSNFWDQPSANKALLLNIISIIGAILIIKFLPDKKEKILPKFSYVSCLYYFSILLAVVVAINAGGFGGLLSGKQTGTFFNYLRLFFNPLTLLALILFLKKPPYRTIFILFLFVVYLTFIGSRSAIIRLLIIGLIFPIFSNYELYRRKIKKFLIFILIISPFLFVLATSKRGYKNIDYSEMIIGRISSIELGMNPVFTKDNPEKSMGDLSLFYKKYNLKHQIRIIINSILPGSLFKDDVDPNQYYKTFFFGMSGEASRKQYMSMPISLPVYIYMYFGFSVSILITICFIVIYYLLWLYSYKRNNYFFLGLILSLYGFMYFFDFVMLFRNLFSIFLTIFSVVIFEKFIPVCKRKLIAWINNSTT